MSTPPIVPVSAGPPATQPTVPTATVTNPPPELGRAVAGTILRGSVVGRSQGGELLVRTDHGVLSLRTPQNLQPGTTVRLEVQTTGNTINVTVLSAARGAPAGSPAGQPGTAPGAPGSAQTSPGAAGTGSAAPAGGGAAATGGTGSTTAAATAPPTTGLPPLSSATSLVPGALVRAQVVPASGTATQLPPLAAGQTTGAGPVPGAATAPGGPAGGSGVPSSTAPASGAAGPATSTATGAPARGLPVGGTTGAAGTPATAAAGGLAAASGAPEAPLVGGLPSGITTLRIVDIAPPPGATGQAAGTVSGQAASVAGGPVVTGTIIGATPGGQPLLQFPGGLAVLASKDVPPGTRVSLEPTQVAASTASRPPLPLPALAAQWGTLQEALSVLQQASPAAAQTLVGATTGGGQLTAGLMLFMSVLSQGDFKAWLGERPLAALQRGGGRDLVDRLGEEFRQLSRAATGETSQGEWRGFFIPIHDGHALSQLRLFVHPHGGEPDAEGHEAGSEGARFILDVDLTRLGQVQLDGLVDSKPDEHGRLRKQLDLIVRTPQALPADMRRDIHDIFERTTGAAGLAGSIAFRAQPKMPPLPVAEVAGHVPSTVV